MSDANPARPAAGAWLCDLEEVPEPGARGFRFRENEAVFAGFVVRWQGAVTGYVDSCPHAGWPLGSLDGRYFTRDMRHILCAGHAALFRPEDGVCVAGPCVRDRLDPWPVTIRDGGVYAA